MWGAAWAGILLASSEFTNFRSTISVRDFVFSGDNVLVATSGGLYFHHPATNGGWLLSEPEKLPDLALTGVAVDPDGNIWVGTQSGYLCRRSPRGEWTTFESYYAADWNITDIYPFKEYLVICSSKGVSLFDLNEERAVKNATGFQGLESPEMTVALVHRDTLFVGGADGAAFLDISGRKLDSLNFYDGSIWRTRRTEEPVVSFPVHRNTAQAASVLQANRGTYVVSADSTTVYLDGVAALTLPSEIQVVKVGPDGTVWFGTTEHYFYSWKGAGDAHQHRVEGLTFDLVKSVLAARDGTVWVTPGFTFRRDAVPHIPWYQRITAYRGNGQWSLESNGNLGTFGRHFQTVLEDNSGNIWIPTYGSGVHFHSGKDGTWSIRNFGTNICTAIAQDSSGYFWIGNDGAEIRNQPGCVICYDSRSDQKEFYFGPGPFYIDHIYSIAVDSRGTVLVGGLDRGFVAFAYTGSPLRGESAITYNKNQFGGMSMGTVHDMEAWSNDSTWIASAAGLFLHQYLSADADVSVLTEIEEVPMGLTSVVSESNNVLWLGSAEGLIRYDVADRSKSILTVEDGLPSNAVNDVSISRSEGVLWVATGGGLSRMKLGHSFSRITDNTEAVVYPNPFRLSHPDHKTVRFEQLVPESRVYIYDPRGALVDEADVESRSRYEWRYEWSPPRRIIPGTYFYIIRSGNDSRVGKLMIVP